MIDTEQVWTTKEIADYIGVEPSTVRTYNKRGFLPKPTSYVGRTPVWTALTIKDWHAKRPYVNK
jgi:predicted site-specific integrase-resolvase